MPRPFWLVSLGVLLVGCAHGGSSARSASPVPVPGDLLDPRDDQAEPRPSPARSEHDAPVPRIVHRSDPFQFAFARDADVALAISDEGHASMFAPSDGRVRASLRISDGSFDQTTRIIADDGSRAIVGSLRETADPDRLFLWHLDRDVHVDLLANLRETSPWYVVADPLVRTIFVALDVRDAIASRDPGSARSTDEEDEAPNAQAQVRYVRFDPLGAVRCSSEPVPRRGPEELLVAADGSALFLDAVDDDPARRIDARSCSVLALSDVDYVLATRPSSGQMVTRDASGTLAFRSPRDGSLLARIPLEHHAMRALYDPSGTYVLLQAANLAMVLSAVDGRVVHSAVPIAGTPQSLASDGASFVVQTPDAIVRIDAGTGRRIEDPNASRRIPPPSGASERMVWDVIPIPSRSSIVVVTARGLVEWSSAGARELRCGGGAVDVIVHGAQVRALSTSSICDLGAGTVFDRQVLATSDDGTLALVVGDANASGEHPIALMDVASLRIRATYPLAPTYTAGLRIERRRFTADGRFAIAQGYERVAIVDARSGRMSTVLPAHLTRVRGRTPDGRAFVVEGDDPETGEALRFRVDPRGPRRFEPYDGPIDEGVVPPRAEVVCTEGRGRVVSPGDPLDGLVLPVCLDGRLSSAGGGQVLVVTSDEAVHLMRRDGSDHVVLRTVFAEETSLPTYSFASDADGRVHVGPEGVEQLVIRRAGDARTAEFAAAAASPEILARIGRLLGARDEASEARPSGPR